MSQASSPSEIEFCEQAFVDKGRDAVLSALDDYVQSVVKHPDAKGWRDEDLPSLFVAVDRHLRTVAARLNHPDSAEPGSARLRTSLNQ